MGTSEHQRCTHVSVCIFVCVSVCVCEHVVQSITNKPQKLQTSEYSYLKLDYGRSKHWKTKRISTICARFERKKEKKRKIETLASHYAGKKGNQSSKVKCQTLKSYLIWDAQILLWTTCWKYDIHTTLHKYVVNVVVIQCN